MRKRINWKDNQEILRKYLEEDLMTYKEVAKIFNTSEMQIAQACRTYNIKYVSSRSHRWTKDEINNLKEYLKIGLNYNEISEKLGMSVSIISAFVNRNRFDYKNATRRIDYKSLNNNEDLVNKVKYLIDHGIPKRDIKKDLNITDLEIESIIKTNNIIAPSFTNLVSRGIYNGRETGLTKDVLYEEIVKNGLSYNEIGQKYGIPSREIRSWASALNIKSSIFISYSENKRSILLEQLNREPTKEEMAKALYHTLDRHFFEDLIKRNNGSIRSSASELGVDFNTIRKATEFYNIPTNKVIKFLDFSKEFYEEKLKAGIKIPDLAELIGLKPQAVIKGLRINFPSLYEKYDIKVRSIGEKLTETALINLGLSFEGQVFILDAVPKEIRPVGIFIDFVIIYNGVIFWIEYNGKQHYKQYDVFQTFERFKLQVLRDLWVKKYCKENNVIFIEIPYIYYSTKKIQDLLQRVIINGEDINNIIDYTPFYKEIEELGISINEN